MTVRILTGDALEQLRLLPDESVHCCVTSPPYYGLRDYGVVGQIGLEPSPDEYVAALVAVFREVRRVLRKDGTLWLNIGDSYAAGKLGRADHGSGDLTSHLGPKRDGIPGGSIMGPVAQRLAPAGYKPKDLLGTPWMLAFALRADGWYLRQDIIWSKPNPMPESVTDRCTKAHEYLFLLSKSERYWFDAAAIAEKANWPGGSWGRSKCYDGDQTGMLRWFYGNGAQWKGGETRNKRSVWEVATQPYADAHFATFPPALIEPAILAGCPRGGTVIDPFAGAGTTGLVADRLGRDAVLIELNPAYAAMARDRIEDDAGMFAEVEAAE